MGEKCTFLVCLAGKKIHGEGHCHKLSHIKNATTIYDASGALIHLGDCETPLTDLQTAIDERFPPAPTQDPAA